MNLCDESIDSDDSNDLDWLESNLPDKKNRSISFSDQAILSKGKKIKTPFTKIPVLSVPRDQNLGYLPSKV